MMTVGLPFSWSRAPSQSPGLAADRVVLPCSSCRHAGRPFAMKIGEQSACTSKDASAVWDGQARLLRRAAS